MEELVKTRDVCEGVYFVEEFLPVGEDLLAVSPVIRSPFEVPLRIVLRSVHDGYVVHAQCFAADEEEGELRWWYHRGDYFTSPHAEDLPKLFAAAYERWLDRCKQEHAYISRRAEFAL